MNSVASSPLPDAEYSSDASAAVLSGTSTPDRLQVPTCKRKLETDTVQQACDPVDALKRPKAGRGAGAAIPLNQGSFGTCVAYAMASAMCNNLISKYGVPFKEELLVEKLKTLFPCWEGNDVFSMLIEWNKVHLESRASIENMDRTKRYNVHAGDVQKLERFDEAYRAMQTAKAQEMFMLCIIKTSQKGHAHHAVALQAFVPGREKMTSVNSWGAHESYKDVTRHNFVYACSFDPVIVKEVGSDKKSKKLPQPQEIYTARKTEHLRMEGLKKELKGLKKKELEGLKKEHGLEMVRDDFKEKYEAEQAKVAANNSQLEEAKRKVERLSTLEMERDDFKEKYEAEQAKVAASNSQLEEAKRKVERLSTSLNETKFLSHSSQLEPTGKGKAVHSIAAGGVSLPPDDKAADPPAGASSSSSAQDMNGALIGETSPKVAASEPSAAEKSVSLASHQSSANLSYSSQQAHTSSSAGQAGAVATGKVNKYDYK
jgi:hypothetical protein